MSADNGLCRRFHETVVSKGIRISCAESCTGGLIGATITEIPGASSYFMGSAVTYSNEAKENILGVPRGLLFAYGAVSAEVAASMARGSKKIYRSDVAVAVTGIAGPGGATAEKPVGLVYIAVSDGCRTVVTRNLFSGDRDAVRSATVEKALEMIIEFTEE